MHRMLSYAKGLFMLALCILSFSLVLLPSAYAAGEGGYTIDLAPVVDALMPTLLGVISLLVSAVLAWLMRLLVKYTGVVLDEKHRKTLDDIVLSKLRQMLTDAYEGNRSSLRVSTKSEVVAELAGYAVRKAPGAIRHFKLDQQGLEEFVAGRVGAKTLGTLREQSSKLGPLPVPPKPKR
ncbi:hypothetical protein [Pseudovibrio sp. POLY-S9]|uniref:hypothetical protein n=1 Tax=Pseudovibrio sp. POLY-S9 TaxID=1576596 RepID=UPI000710A603|nr:hypothetical protein [Pseudovibrio sp. POLY-S9]